MPMYEYIAKSVDGNIKKGKIEAINMQVVADGLRQNNYYPVNIKPYNTLLNMEVSVFDRISIRDIAIFCRQFSFILSSGISIVRGIEIVIEQTENNKLKKMLMAVHEDVQKGVSFSEAMGQFKKDIPNMLINMISVGEASGTLDKVMTRMADYYDKEYRLHQKVKSALTYPIIVSIFAILVVVLLVTVVLPKFVDMIQNGSGSKILPLPTRIVLGISNCLRSYGFIILGIIIAIIICLKLIKKNNQNASEALDKFKITVPVFGKINKKIITSRFARTFATLMSSGVPLIQSIEICASIVENSIVENVLQFSKEEIKKGESLGVTLEDKEVFPVMLTQMIKIGEESGTLDSILEKTAEFYDTEVETATTQLTTLIEPIIIVLLAVVVGFIILSIILPIFQSYDSMG